MPLFSFPLSPFPCSSTLTHPPLTQTTHHCLTTSSSRIHNTLILITIRPLIAPISHSHSSLLHQTSRPTARTERPAHRPPYNASPRRPLSPADLGANRPPSESPPYHRSANSHLSPSSTLTPATSAAAPTLLPRCGNGDCTYPSGPESTLSASPITTTILSTTSVPCYITTITTSSTTLVSTVYSTETITSTVTSDGTVYIVQYSPTPVLMSSTYETVVQVTVPLISYWLTTEGSMVASTYSVQGGGQQAGGWGSGASFGNKVMSTQQGMQGSVSTGTMAVPSQGGQSADAWTHAAGGASGGGTAGAGAAPATKAAQDNAGAQTVDANNAWGAGGGPAGSPSNSAGGITWSNGSARRGGGERGGWEIALVLGLSVGIIFLREGGRWV